MATADALPAATPSTITNNLVLYTPSFDFDFAGVRLDESGDLNPFDAAEIVAQSKVTDAMLALYHRAGAPPAVAFGCEAGHLRVLSASFRLAGLRAAHLDDSATVESCHQQVAELRAGRLDSRGKGRYAGSRHARRLLYGNGDNPFIGILRQ